MTLDQFLGLFNYWIVIVLMMTGFYIVISSGNLIKTVIGLNIFQISVILLYITMGKVTHGTAPILLESHGHHSAHHASADAHHEPADAHHASADAHHASVDAHHRDGLEQDHHADDNHSPEKNAVHSPPGSHGVSNHAANTTVYSNPLPSVLMLTAIVVGVATTALALALIVRVREDYGSIEEYDILALDANGLAEGLSSSRAVQGTRRD